MSSENDKCIIIKPSNDNTKRDYDTIIIIKNKNNPEIKCPRDLHKINCKDCPRINFCDKSEIF